MQTCAGNEKLTFKAVTALATKIRGINQLKLSTLALDARLRTSVASLAVIDKIQGGADRLC